MYSNQLFSDDFNDLVHVHVPERHGFFDNDSISGTSGNDLSNCEDNNKYVETIIVYVNHNIRDQETTYTCTDPDPSQPTSDQTKGN